MSSKSVRVRFCPQMSLGHVLPLNKLGGKLCFQSCLQFVIPYLGGQYLQDSSSLALAYSPTSTPRPPSPHPLPSIPHPHISQCKLTPVGPRKVVSQRQGNTVQVPGVSVWLGEGGGGGRKCSSRQQTRERSRDCYREVGSCGQLGRPCLGWKSEVSRCPLILSSVTA